MTQPITFWIKPNPDRVVLLRDPVTGAPLASAGEAKPKNAHWLRRVRDNDAVQIDEPQHTLAKKKKPAAEKPQ